MINTEVVMMKKAVNQYKKFLVERYGKDKTNDILKYSFDKYKNLCEENKDETNAVKSHTVKKIYPCISLYEGMQESGIDKKQALEFLDYSTSKLAEKEAKSIQLFLKIPGLYKKMPAIFKWVTVHQFGEKAGFKAEFYKTEKTRVKFDMTKCLYCDVCEKYGCPELVVCFCHTDDVKDGNMHPALCWNRTKIMGDGGDVCDFDLFVK